MATARAPAVEGVVFGLIRDLVFEEAERSPFGLVAREPEGEPALTLSVAGGAFALDASPGTWLMTATAMGYEPSETVVEVQTDGLVTEDLVMPILYLCDDGLDNDLDGWVDYPEDLGCKDATSNLENPQCQDGINNDRWAQDPNPGRIDFDGGASLDLDGNGYIDPLFNPAAPAVTEPDPQCIGKPWKNAERKSNTQCGAGIGPTLLLLPMMWLWRRRRPSLH